MIFIKWPTFSKFIDFNAESIDFTTPAIEPVTWYNVTKYVKILVRV